MNLNQNPLFGAILAATSVVSGGCAVAAGLAIREIHQHSWGWYPVEEMQVLMVQLIVSVAVCLGAAFWWTYQTSPSEEPSR
jgi:tartrate dehydratase beta subunit/fumarate hydratase class I family protein